MMVSYSVMRDVSGYLDKAQVQKILEQCRLTRNYILIYLLWKTGRRISELLPLKVKDIDLEGGTIKFKILKKKNKNYYKIKPIDTATILVLTKYFVGKNPEDYLFQSPYKPEQPLSRQQAHTIVRNLAEKAGIYYAGERPVHPHTFRHSFSVHFLRNAKNRASALMLLQNLLEHSSVAVTGHYLQFSQEDTREELENVFSEEKEE